MAVTEVSEAELQARNELNRLAPQLRAVIEKIRALDAERKELVTERASLEGSCLYELSNLGGNRFTMDGVITLWAEPQVKVWVDKEQVPAAITFFQSEAIPGVVGVMWQSLQAWGRERLEAGDELPDFCNKSEEIVIRTRIAR